MLWHLAEKLIKKNKFNKPLSLGGYPCDITRLWNYQHIWRREFRFDYEVVTGAKIRLTKAIDQWKKQNNLDINSINPIVVMVHVRRTDYINWLIRIKGEVPDTPYFAAAFDYFTKR